MADILDASVRLQELIERRVTLERTIENEQSELSEQKVTELDGKYDALQRSLYRLFRETSDDSLRITIMLELIRILENKLVHLRHFSVTPAPETRGLAEIVARFLDQLEGEPHPPLSPLELSYYRAIAALHAGDLDRAREGLLATCESEESDEANDIKFKSYVILGNLFHEEHDYARARDLHDASVQYSRNSNVAAQALAFKALNSYALGETEQARSLFESSLALFQRSEPFFNSYFHRNALLFCGLIYYDRGEYRKAEKFYQTLVDEVDQSSYDYFDALTQLGKICYRTGRFDEAVRRFSNAIEQHRYSENEHLIDTWFWLARAHVERGDLAEARRCLDKVTTSEVEYGRKSQAVELLRRLAG
ncbi:MAG: tetratricopeptide repeat protein [Thermoanaerobaculia bacterium]